jgi:hypothetical protein
METRYLEVIAIQGQQEPILKLPQETFPTPPPSYRHFILAPPLGADFDYMKP